MYSNASPVHSPRHSVTVVVPRIAAHEVDVADRFHGAGTRVVRHLASSGSAVSDTHQQNLGVSAERRMGRVVLGYT